MSTDVDQAADTVIGLTNTVGATAASVRSATQAAGAIRRVAEGAARQPERVALGGMGLLAIAGLLALSKSRATSRSAQPR